MKAYDFLKSLRAVLEILSWVGIIFMVVLFARGAGLSGAPDAQTGGDGGLVETYGMRMVLLLLFAAGGGLIGLLFLGARFPKLYKYPVRITAQNVEVQYLLAKIMLNALEIVCALYFIILMVGVHNRTIALESIEFLQLSFGAGGIAGAVFLLYLAAARKYRR